MFFVTAVLKQLLFYWLHNFIEQILISWQQVYQSFWISMPRRLKVHYYRAKTQSLFFWSGFPLLNVYLENYYPCTDIPETSRENPFVSVKIAIRRPKRPEHLKASETGLNYSLKLNLKFPKLPCLPSSIRIQISKADSRLATYYIGIKNTKTINPTNGCHFMKTIYLPTPK